MALSDDVGRKVVLGFTSACFGPRCKLRIAHSREVSIGQRMRTKESTQDSPSNATTKDAAKDAIAESCSTAMSQLPRDDELPDLTDMTCPPVPGPEEVVGGQE